MSDERAVDEAGRLQMLYPEFVDRAMRSQEPVTEIREVGEHRRIYSAAQYDRDSEAVWRADIDAVHHPDYDATPSVGFAKSYPTSDTRVLQKWTPLATGRLGGPQKLGPWESLFTVFNAALSVYHEEAPIDDHSQGDER